MPANVTSDIGLVGLSASEMARQVAAGDVTSAELVEAHIARIQAVNPTINAVVVLAFRSRPARKPPRPTRRAARGEPLGPLHGVPITIKECFHLTGTPATEGVNRFARESEFGR